LRRADKNLWLDSQSCYYFFDSNKVIVFYIMDLQTKFEMKFLLLFSS
jgi:uncharacterized protein YhbP (UPF0306 family)